MADIPPLPGGWTRCREYMKRKNRYCRQECTPQTHFCGYHAKRARIPCPIDPSHSVVNIERHVKVCPTLKRKRERESKAYYCEGCNRGGFGCVSIDERPPIDLPAAKDLALLVLTSFQRIFEANASKKPQHLTFDDIYSALDESDVSPSILSGLQEVVTKYRIKSGGSHHLQQQASLIGHLRPILEQESAKTVLELGAGRGVTGILTAGVSKGPTKLYIIERGSSKEKADKILRAREDHQTQLDFDLTKLAWNRVECDLADLKIDSLVEKDEKIVSVAKHLCGAGTDLALKSLVPIRHQITASVFATCCHGVCSWQDYVGRLYLQDIMGKEFGEQEFDLMRKWTTGTVVTTKPKKSDSEEHVVPKIEAGNHTIHDVVGEFSCGIAGLGRACQRLFDYGRVEFMKRELFEGINMKVQLFHYIEQSVSPQNAVLIAVKDVDSANTIELTD